MKICHYTSAKNAIQILSSQQFKFGHLENSNDPFENLRKRYELSFNIQEPLNSFMNNIFEYANNRLAYASFGLIEDGKRNDQNWTMWAHYSKNHSGVCLTFHFESLLAELEKQSVCFLHDRIKYTNALIITPNYFEERMHKTPNQIIKEFYKPLLFSKHEGWESENEYRIIVFKKDIALPIQCCLKQVLLGPEIDEWHESRIESILRKINFKGPYGKLSYSYASYARPSKFFFHELKESSIN